ncbi:MAG: hypothetical protein AB8G14_07810 [Ilumatobacter sp.]
MTALKPWSVTAVNLAEHAENSIHTDAGARAAGFSGALVAGVTTYAYLTHLPVSAWGIDWLTRGGAEVRFLQPVMDRDRVDIAPTNGMSVGATVDGQTRAVAEFVEQAEPIPIRDGPMLAPIEFVLDHSWSDYGDRAGDDSAIYEHRRIAHATSWPRIANQFCHEQLVTGSWIHVRSRIAHHGVAPVGSLVRATAVVTDRFDSRAGERALLDIRISADGEAVASMEHEAIISLPD